MQAAVGRDPLQNLTRYNHPAIIRNPAFGDVNVTLP